MSKLIDSITVEATGRKFAPRPKYDLLSIEREVDTSIPIFTEYRVRVTLGCAIRIDETLADLSRIDGEFSPVRRVALMIEQEVFGEFREGIHAIHRALWDGDCQGAIELLQKLEVQMFSASMGNGQ